MDNFLMNAFVATKMVKIMISGNCFTFVRHYGLTQPDILLPYCQYFPDGRLFVIFAARQNRDSSLPDEAL
jgi:hypothetical protein